MTEDGTDQIDPPSPEVVAALLREARSVSRRADQLGADVGAMQDPTDPGDEQQTGHLADKQQECVHPTRSNDHGDSAVGACGVQHSERAISAHD